MGVVLFVTRGGRGTPWRLSSLAEARLHPLMQLGDPILSSAEDVSRTWNPQEWNDLSLVLLKSPVREIAEAAWTRARDGERGVKTALREASQEVWSWMLRIARDPPGDPGELIRLIREDRAAIEGVVLLSRRSGQPRTDLSDQSPTGVATGEVRVMSEAAAEKAADQPKEKRGRKPAAEKTPMLKGDRVRDESIIRMKKNAEGVPYGAANNPKRPGSNAATRFAYYRDGMTVAEAKAAGVTASDVRYDTEHNFITLESAPVAAAAAA